ncbi:MAG: hypothetical protein Q4G24_13975 [Paracoccus sp. (in: a-proteobacteria)]|uniref:hypothetical protein n=1 Tax=Paracoccus sp. TaxID=267 RepID=UPI0026DF879F|nr:hypothetical protein [Paracoccus sp. (in: a-proteobacteria)]MDO5622566.1 hypothetical protein [Paracoccus sp. (in: a-proteobacteria)]
MHRWRTERMAITRKAVSAVIRVRRDPARGIHPSTHFIALNYFSAIWPDGLSWPEGVKRPDGETSVTLRIA